MFGYGGRILTVDVTSGDQRVEEFDAAFARAYLGGNGFAAKLCYDRIPPGIDAFDPRNLVVFGTGPITDSVIPGNNRNCVAGKSPLNGLFFDSTFGGRFAGTQRHTGFDAIVITGAAAEPGYILGGGQGGAPPPPPGPSGPASTPPGTSGGNRPCRRPRPSWIARGGIPTSSASGRPGSGAFASPPWPTTGRTARRSGRAGVSRPSLGPRTSRRFSSAAATRL